MTPSLLTENVPHVVDSLIADDLSDPEWLLHEPGYQCARMATEHPGVYAVNLAQSAQPGGGVYTIMPAPADAVECVFEAEIKLPPGVASSAPVALVIYTPHNGSHLYSTSTPGADWQRVEVRFPAAAGRDHQVSIAVNHTGVAAGPQARCLVRRVRARYVGGSSLVAMPFRRFDISGEPLVLSLHDAPHALGGRRPSTQARCRFRANARRIGIRWWSTLGQFPDQASIVVRVNGGTVATLTPGPTDYGKRLYSEVDLPDLGQDVEVEVINGIQGDHPLIWGGASDPIGTYMHALVVPQRARVQFVRERSERRILFEGASIVSGWSAKNPSINSWFALLRDELAGEADVVARAWGWRPCHTIAKDAVAIAAYVEGLKASSFDATDLILHLETNDYAGPPSNGDGGGAWSAADYQIGKAALVDALLDAFPEMVIWLPSMEVRSDEGVPNGHGCVPQDYRDATAAIASTRGPRVRFIDGMENLAPSDLADACHPKHGAASKFARFMLECLRQPS